MWILIFSIVFLINWNANDRLVQSKNPSVDYNVKKKDVIKKSLYHFNLNSVNDEIMKSEKVDTEIEGKCCKKHKSKKKNKYLIPMLIGWLLIKSILLPIALKALALLSGAAFVLSSMSLILAAIMGFRRLTQSGFITFGVPTADINNKNGRGEDYGEQMYDNQSPYYK